jgi:DNA-binding NtrC family response regulator
MAAFHLLVVDDDSLIIQSIKAILPADWVMTSSNTGMDLDDRLVVHAAMVDMHLDKSGVAQGPRIIQKLLDSNPQIEAIAMSGDLSLDLMEACLKAGAKRYLAKPLLKDEVLSVLDKIQALWNLRLLNSQIFSQGHSRLYGPSTAGEKLAHDLASLAGEPGPILIEGETGTGKEEAFKQLNQQERNRPFVAVNISGLSDSLFESELFGHVKGAFTGADQTKIGLLEAAHGGDLFLDEIEALPLHHQVKLLRFLESGEFKKVGAKESQISRCRVIVASNESLAKLVQEGKFREDLYYRLSGKKLSLPALRDRKEDIPRLAEFFLNRLKPRLNKTWSAGAIELLQTYSWPGNIRELKRVTEQVALICPLPVIRPQDLEHLLAVGTAKKESMALDLSKGLSHLLEEREKELIELALEKCQTADQAAELLQVSRSTFYKKIKDFGIGQPQKDS